MASSTGPGYAGGTITQAAVSTTSATVLAAGGSRRGFIITNGTAGKLSLAFGPAAASATNWTIQLAAGATYEQEAGTATYAGAITGILDTGSGNAQVTTW